MAPDPIKGSHYLQQLEDARCNGIWDAVPEMVRKVRKHAPERSCIALTAETEYAIAKAAESQRPSTRPSTAAPPQNLDSGTLSPKLLTAIDDEGTYLEDRFQAQVCLGWLHWVAGDYKDALARLPKSIDQEYSQLEDLDKLAEWTKVCALRSAYLKGNCLSRVKKRVEALEVFEAALPIMSSVWATPKPRKQLEYWSELFLTEFAMMWSQALEQGERSLEDPNCLACFRSWARYWEGPAGKPLTGGWGFRGAVPRRRIWAEYYAAISRILQEDLPFPNGSVEPATNESSARNRLRAELKKAEAAYEALLLSETEFPRADEEREEVEAFVKLVMQNWVILGGRGWREQDLGQGGRESLSHGVLDILYRAATKTFHSTAILRHLFTVHVSVAEFDLAFKAFDAYLEIVTKGKARVEKTGQPEPSLDDDATVMRTMSSCIACLCRYGHHEAAEKARDLSHKLEGWLKNLPHKLHTEATPRPLGETSNSKAAQAQIPPDVLAVAWQSVGLAQAHWSKTTFDSTSRTEIQAKAIGCLRKSLSSEYGRTTDLGSVFALGLLLAEQRQLTIAIELIKSTLIASKVSEDTPELYTGPYWRERSLIPLWHLLSLLLSARQDYVLAARACEGAFEQFQDPTILFGSDKLNGAFRSAHLNEIEENGSNSELGKGLVDGMDDLEKEGILEVKMTQLALVELLEGPATAVNASSELLSLFARLFGKVEDKAEEPPKTAKEVPKSSAGTVRSIKSSIFGASRSQRTAVTNRESMLSAEKVPPVPARPETMQTAVNSVAPTIQVSQDNGAAAEARRTRRAASTSDRQGSIQKRNSLKKKDRSAPPSRSASSSGYPRRQGPTVVDGETFFTPMDAENRGNSDYFLNSRGRRPSFSGQAPPMNRTLSHADSYHSTKTPSTPFTELSVDRIGTTSWLTPLIQFPQDHERRQRGAILIKVWLMIAGFYRRADMFHECKSAVAEAQKRVQALEADVSKDLSGALSIREAGWAGKKSVEELYADVWAEFGYLSLAKGAPYEARGKFEAALIHSPNHPGAIVGLSNILLDIYSETLLPLPAVPELKLSDGSTPVPGGITLFAGTQNPNVKRPGPLPTLPREPLGMSRAKPKSSKHDTEAVETDDGEDPSQEPGLSPPYKAKSLPLIDRLAARDRAYGLLKGLTKLGSAWNYSEAWFALARAHEESGQPDKAKEVLWWCVELEEGAGVRDWSCVGAGRYVL